MLTRWAKVGVLVLFTTPWGCSSDNGSSGVGGQAGSSAGSGGSGGDDAGSGGLDAGAAGSGGSSASAGQGGGGCGATSGSGGGGTGGLGTGGLGTGGVTAAPCPSDPPVVGAECKFNQKCGYAVAANCAANCIGYQTDTFTCPCAGSPSTPCAVAATWQPPQSSQPTCFCDPAPTVPGCTQTSAEFLAPDGCKLSYSCGTTVMDISCDGEGDGVSSLCDCYKNGSFVPGSDGPVCGQGMAPCHAAAVACAAAG